jgi:hypothetical protein
LTPVSTGTWTVAISSGDFYKEISSVTVYVGQNIMIPNALTDPTYQDPNMPTILLNDATLNGFVAGMVTNALGNPIPDLTVLIGGGVSKITGANGAYFTSISSGAVPIIVNPNNSDPAYVQSIAIPTVYSGQLTVQDFTVLQGGVIRGFVTTGTTPLPNIVVTASVGGNQAGAGTSDATGMFTIRNLSTGTYTVQPALEIGQDSSPNNYTAALDAGETVEVGTFTIAGAFGTIAGKVRDAGGSLVTSGALIIAAESDPPNPPWSVCGSSAQALTPFYSVSSKADGSYALQVRGSTTTAYYLRVYYPSIDLNTGNLTLKQNGYSNVSVSPSATTTRDLSLP